MKILYINCFCEFTDKVIETATYWNQNITDDYELELEALKLLANELNVDLSQDTRYPGLTELFNIYECFENQKNIRVDVLVFEETDKTLRLY